MKTAIEDFSTQNSTKDLPSAVRTMNEMLDRMSAKIKALIQEVMDQETRYKNASKELCKLIQEQNVKIAVNWM